MGRMKEYLVGLAEDIIASGLIDEEDLMDNSIQNQNIINNALEKIARDNYEFDEQLQSFILGNKSVLMEIIADMLNVSIEPEEMEDDETWTDPAGGIHYADEEDPAKQYESVDEIRMPRMFEKAGEFGYDQEQYMYWWIDQVQQYLATHFDYSESDAMSITEDYQDELRKLFDKHVSPKDAAFEIDEMIYAEEEFKQEDTNVIDKVQKEQKIQKDYSKMSRSELEKEADKALAAKDFETLKQISQYIRESKNNDIIMQSINEWKWGRKPEQTNPYDENDPMQDVWDAGQKIVKMLKNLGLEGATLTNMGRSGGSKKSKMGFTVEFESADHEFEINLDGTVIYRGLMYPWRADQRKNIELGNIDDPKEVQKNLERIVI